MKTCWNRGDLRAYVDRELPPNETVRLEAHLASCEICEGRLREISQRAERVSRMLGELGAYAVPAPVPVRRVWPARAAALALAASLGLIFLSPKPAPPPKAEVTRPFVALDNEPIETGMVVRVAFGPQQIQADVIVAPDGRPRAYRLVDNPSTTEGVKTE